MQNLKIANKVLFRDLFEGYTWGTASQKALRNCSKEVREDTGYIWSGLFVSFLGKKKNQGCSWKKVITTNHKEERSQVHDFSVFLCLGRGSGFIEAIY